MTDAQLEAIFKANVVTSYMTALHAVYTAGYLAGAGSTASAKSPDQVGKATAPAVIPVLPHCGK